MSRVVLIKTVILLIAAVLCSLTCKAQDTGITRDASVFGLNGQLMLEALVKGLDGKGQRSRPFQ